jgi:hypothetical protein
MAPRFVIDETVINQIDRNNKPAITLLTALLRAPGAQVWITAGNYARLRPVDQAFINDVGIHTPLQDNYYERYRDKGMLDTFSQRFKTTAALAFHLNAEVISLDAGFLLAWRRAGGQVEMHAPSLTNVEGDVDYNQARRAFGLEPVVISGDSIVPVEKGSGQKPTIVNVPAKDTNAVNAPEAYNGPRTKGGARLIGAKRQQGRGDPQDSRLPAQVDMDHVAVGDAVMGGIVVTLQGVNLVFKRINSDRNEDAFKKEWNRKSLIIQQNLNEDPSLGAQIYANYKEDKQAQHEASQIDAAVEFTDITVAYGHSEYEASQNIPDSYKARPPGFSTETQWIPPRQPLDLSQLATPFGTAQVLATFVKGKSLLVPTGFAIKGKPWGHGSGFYLDGDDDVELGPTGNGVPPQFLVLSPPSKVSYFLNQHWNEKDLRDDLDFKFPGETEVDLGRFKYQGLTVMKLKGDTTAAMVWPADKTTQRLFEATKPTDDKESYLAYYAKAMKLIRWVYPENLHVIKLVE